MALARRLDHKYSQALAFAYAALLHQMRLDPERVLACAEAAVELCERYEFGYYGDWARVLIGWARGQERAGRRRPIIESALERLDRSRAQARRPYYLSLLAETYGRLGDRDRAASILDRAVSMAVDRGDVWWLPALYLQRSELDRRDRPRRDTRSGRSTLARGTAQPRPRTADSRVVPVANARANAFGTLGLIASSSGGSL